MVQRKMSLEESLFLLGLPLDINKFLTFGLSILDVHLLQNEFSNFTRD